MASVAILIPVHNNLSYTKECLNQLSNNIEKDEVKSEYQVVVVDDGSTDGTSDWIKIHHPEVKILKGDGNLWWSGGINKGAKYAVEHLNCSHLLLWNNDIGTTQNYFKKAIEMCMLHGDDVILGSKIYADKTQKIVWSYGGSFNPVTGNTKMWGYMKPDSDLFSVKKEVDWLTGMGTIVPASVIYKIGYWNDKDFPQYHGDTEFTYRAKLNGFKNIVIPELVLWNDISNSGIKKKQTLKDLKHLLTDRRSLMNFSVNYKFLSQYSKSPLAYFYMLKMYFFFFGGFIKHKIFRGKNS